MKYKGLEIRDMGNTIYIIDKVNHGWYIEWITETTVRLLHCNRRLINGSNYHLQREFVDLTRENLDIIFKYIWNHQNFVIEKRYKPHKQRIDYLFESIKKKK